MLEFRIAASLIMLCYSSYLDIRSREVNEKYWVFFLAIGLSLYLYEIIFDKIFLELYQLTFALGITLVFGFTFYYFGFYGGADFFALVTLSILIPIYFPPNYLHPIASLIVITNATFLVMILPIFFFFRNIAFLIKGEKIFSGFEEEKKLKKIIVLFLGYRMNKVEKKDFYIPLEKTDGNIRKFSIHLLSEEEDFLAGKDIWATPGLPMLLFLTFGFLAMIFWGDFITFIIKIIL